MEGGEECSSNESGWTKYIDPSDNEHSGVDDDDDDNDHHSHHNYNYKKVKKDDDDHDSTESDASSGPGYYKDATENHHRHHHHQQHHGGKKSSKEIKERNSERNVNSAIRYGTTVKGKEAMLKTNKPSSTAFSLKQRKGKKPN